MATRPRPFAVRGAPAGRTVASLPAAVVALAVVVSLLASLPLPGESGARAGASRTTMLALPSALPLNARPAEVATSASVAPDSGSCSPPILGTIRVGSNPGVPGGITLDSGTNIAYVANDGSSTVSAILTTTDTVVATIPVGINPWTPTFVAANNLLYVPNAGSSNITVVSPSTEKVYGNIAVGPQPETPVYDPANGDLYVFDRGSGNLSIIAVSSDTVIKTIQVDTFSESAETAPLFDAANGNVYVPNYNNNTVTVVHGATNKVIATIPVGTNPGYPAGPTLDPANGEIYVSNLNSGNVSVISGATNSVVATIATHGGPETPVLDPANGLMFVANAYGVDYMINTTTNTASTIPNSGVSNAGAFDPVDGDFYVPRNSVGGRLDIFPGTGAAGLAIVTGGLAAQSPPLFDPASGDVLVADYNTGRVYVLVGTTPQSLCISASSTPASGVSGIPLAFNSTAAWGFAFYSYSWQFGDNGTSAVENTTYTYARAGSFHVAAEVTDGNGNHAWSNFTVNISEGYNVTFVEKGLPSGWNWSVRSGATTEYNVSETAGRGSTGSVRFLSPNGTFAFAIASPVTCGCSVSTYAPARISGTGNPSLTSGPIAGTAPVWTVQFNVVNFVGFNGTSAARFAIYHGGQWKVNLTPLVSAGGPPSVTVLSNLSSPSSVVGAYLPAGVPYRFSVTVLGTVAADYKVLAGTGIAQASLNLSQQPLHTVKFRLLTVPVLFLERSTATSGNWTVSIVSGNTPAVSYPHNGSRPIGHGAIRFNLPNGTYNWTISTGPGTTPSPASGSFSVTVPSPPHRIHVYLPVVLGTALVLGTPTSFTGGTHTPGCSATDLCYAIGVSAGSFGLRAANLSFGLVNGSNASVSFGSGHLTLLTSTGIALAATWSGSGTCSGRACGVAVRAGMTIVFDSGAPSDLFASDTLRAIGSGLFSGTVSTSPLP